MNNIIFLCYGNQIYSQEAAFCIYSALRLLPIREEIRFIAYTDCPEEFSDLPVAVEPADSDRIEGWRGPDDFVHRAKVCCLMDATTRYEGKFLYMDGDTYFKKDPRRIFRRIGPGSSVMHVREGTLYSWAMDIARLVEGGPLPTATHGTWTISPYTVTRNAGVIGIDRSDARLLDDVLRMSDTVYSSTRSAVSEQFSFSVVLERLTRRSEAFDTIHHYWHGPTRSEFRDKLPRILAEVAGLPEAEKARQLWGHRPLEPLSWRLPFRIKLAAKRLGLFPKGLTRPRPEPPAG